MSGEDGSKEVTYERTELRDVIRRATFVLFDFDGPICRLFPGDSARDIGREQLLWLESKGRLDVLTRTEQRRLDPHAALAKVGGLPQHGALARQMEKRLAEDELQAVHSAFPTPYADPVIRTWQAVGARLAVATNNSPEAVRRYLAGRGLSGCFEPHIYGRTQELELLKPDPHCLNRALRGLEADASDALMVGDTVSDFTAARAAGVPFLGYARGSAEAADLTAAGARHVVGSLEEVLAILRDRA
ncbi:HAD family hydrolase [Streptomyces sp. VRA16 Mangrove soil]|nr:HAD family hydrolase [Streptomyces sp. VRA16 Mangrove soil]